MKKAIIVGSVPIGKEKDELLKLIKTEEYYLIAADGGISFFLENNLSPGHFIGDMDSVDSNETVAIVKERFPELLINSCSPIKDVTDMEIGIEDAISKGANEILIYGGLGGKRMSHTIANIQLISRYKDNNIDITMYDANAKVYIIGDGEKVEYSEDNEGFISVFSLSDISKNVKITGFFYEFEGNLYNTNALGVSNEFIGKKSRIALSKGVLLIVEES